MIHPATEIRKIDENIGMGVFATTDIPRGTIVYVKDDMEIVLDKHDVLCVDPLYRKHIEKYSYTEADGSKVLSWDIAKYVNHSCNANTLSTGYGFEIAIRDINAGEEITDDYGMLNIEMPMECSCGSHLCRGVVGNQEFDSYFYEWDIKVQAAFAMLDAVEQPLLDYLLPYVRHMLFSYLDTGEGYVSVRNLEHRLERQSVA